ncbi:MAG: Co2+/Mg2+ efflux protein ApaG [Pseudomonadota bacterium]
MPRAQFTVRAQTRFLPEQSAPEQSLYAFAYTLTIENTGDVAAQLIGRHWTIVDAAGTVQQVSGLAVVGHQPLLKPGERFEYTSWAQIATPRGSMRGRFLCVTDACEPFDAPVPEFALALPSALH